MFHLFPPTILTLNQPATMAGITNITHCRASQSSSLGPARLYQFGPGD